MNKTASNEVTTNTILVIDDDEATRKAVVLILQRAGHQVAEAESGEEGLMLVKKNKYPLVVVDVIMPGMPGDELCQIIKSDKELSDTFVVLISGLRVSNDDKSMGIASGADSYITRPVAHQQLVTLVNILLRLRSAEIDLQNQTALIESNQTREISALESFHGASSTSLTAQMLGVPGYDNFTEDGMMESLIIRYSSIIELAVEQHARQIHLNTTEKLRSFGQDLGKLNARPRDIINLHKNVLKEQLRDIPRSRLQLYIDESRFCLLELMGYLATYYRTIALEKLSQSSYTATSFNQKGSGEHE